MSASAADRVEHRGHGKDFGHMTSSVGNRELRQPRTWADGGKSCHAEQPERLRARANTRLIAWLAAVAEFQTGAPELDDLRAAFTAGRRGARVCRCCMGHLMS